MAYPNIRSRYDVEITDSKGHDRVRSVSRYDGEMKIIVYRKGDHDKCHASVAGSFVIPKRSKRSDDVLVLLESGIERIIASDADHFEK